MIRKLILGVAIAFVSSAALAQNPTCPTRPNTDSSNACASTAFVQNVASGNLPLANGDIFIGNVSNIAIARAMSGDCTISNTGVITCTKLNSVSPGTLFPLNVGTGLGISGGNLNVSYANPSASVGLSAINGSATTAMRSDAAPPLSQTIAPTMTGLWTFAGANGITVAPTTLPSTPGIYNATGIIGNNILFYGVSSGSFASPSASAATIVLADNSIGHSALIDVRALNSAGTVKDAAFGINPGFQYWDAGHEQSDIDFYGYVNGVPSTGLMTISAGCIAVTNVNPNSCGTTRPSNVSPGVDATFDLGSIVASPQLRWNNIFAAGYAVTGGVAIASLPSCSSTIKGARMYVTNGQTTPTFLGTVSSTGAVVAPVFCNGTAWVYG